jgi:hypothetical protein
MAKTRKLVSHVSSYNRIVKTKSGGTKRTFVQALMRKNPKRK